MLVFFLLLSTLLTLIAGIVLVMLYRRTVRGHMQTRTAARAAQAVEVSKTAAEHAQPSSSHETPPDTITPAAMPTRDVSGALRAGRAAYARAATVYTIAGLVHAAISTALYHLIGGLEFSLIRTPIVFWAFAWPALLTLVLLWGPDRKRQGLTVLAYFAVLAAFSIWVGAFSQTTPLEMTWPTTFTLPPFAQPLLFWVMFASSSMFQLVFLNRQVRNVGPLILLFMSIAVTGAMVVGLLQSSGTTALQVMVRIMVFLEAMYPTLGSDFALIATLYGLQVLGAVLFAIPAWLLVRWIVQRYAAKKISDQAIMFDSLWLLMTLFFSYDLSFAGAIGWLGILAFVGYKLTVIVGLRPLQRAAESRDAPRLLLLRTFGTRRRSEQLFDLLATRWRYAGNIELIAGPDLATSALDLHDFLDFVSGRLRRNFIHDERDLARRVAAIDVRPDPDGRYRIDSFFCAADIWQQTVAELIGRIDVVLMDLRTFSARHAGCRFELEALGKLVPLDRVVLLIDRTTDEALVREILGGSASTPQPITSQPHLLRVDGATAAAVGKFFDICRGITQRGGITSVGRPVSGWGALRSDRIGVL
jgi:hypothetical protein